MAGIASKLPADFLSALQAGWEVVAETSKLSTDRTERNGYIVLRADERSIQIDYTATAGRYNFGKPRIV